MADKLVNLCRFVTATTGTGTLTVGAAVSGFLTPALAGVVNGDTVIYSIADGANSECGRGTYSTTGPTLARTTVFKSTNSDALISLSGSAQVVLTATAETLALLAPLSAPGGVVTGQYGGTGVANTSKTLTLGASLTTTGAGAPTLAFPASPFTFTFPGASSTLATLAGSEALTNKTYNGNTITTGTGTLTLGAGKTLTASNTLTLTATDGSTLAIGTGGTLGLNAYISTVFAPLASPLFTGTVTMPGASTFTTSGFSNTASFTTASTRPFTFSPSVSFSTTASLFMDLHSPTLTPTGASASVIGGMQGTPVLGTYSGAVAAFQGYRLGVTIGAGYSGTASSLDTMVLLAPTNSGSLPATAATTLTVAGTITNGDGITSGAVTNQGLIVTGPTAAAGAGGTMTNRAGSFTLPTGSSATTTNTGLRITGNGGAASTNWAIFSDSTALSQLLGLRIGTGAAIATTAVTPFLHLTTCAGTPTGVPTNAAVGAASVVYDSTGKKLWIYDSGTATWKGVVVA